MSNFSKITRDILEIKDKYTKETCLNVSDVRTPTEKGKVCDIPLYNNLSASFSHLKCSKNQKRELENKIFDRTKASTAADYYRTVSSILVKNGYLKGKDFLCIGEREGAKLASLQTMKGITLLVDTENEPEVYNGSTLEQAYESYVEEYGQYHPFDIVQVDFNYDDEGNRATVLVELPFLWAFVAKVQYEAEF